MRLHHCRCPYVVEIHLGLPPNLRMDEEDVADMVLPSPIEDTINLTGHMEARWMELRDAVWDFCHYCTRRGVGVAVGHVPAGVNSLGNGMNPWSSRGTSVSVMAMVFQTRYITYSIFCLPGDWRIPESDLCTYHHPQLAATGPFLPLVCDTSMERVLQIRFHHLLPVFI